LPTNDFILSDPHFSHKTNQKFFKKPLALKRTFDIFSAPFRLEGTLSRGRGSARRMDSMVAGR